MSQNTIPLKLFQWSAASKGFHSGWFPTGTSPVTNPETEMEIVGAGTFGSDLQLSGQHWNDQALSHTTDAHKVFPASFPLQWTSLLPGCVCVNRKSKGYRSYVFSHSGQRKRIGWLSDMCAGGHHGGEKGGTPQSCMFCFTGPRTPDDHETRDGRLGGTCVCGRVGGVLRVGELCGRVVYMCCCLHCLVAQTTMSMYIFLNLPNLCKFLNFLVYIIWWPDGPPTPLPSQTSPIWYVGRPSRSGPWYVPMVRLRCACTRYATTTPPLTKSYEAWSLEWGYVACLPVGNSAPE